MKYLYLKHMLITSFFAFITANCSFSPKHSEYVVCGESVCQAGYVCSEDNVCVLPSDTQGDAAMQGDGIGSDADEQGDSAGDASFADQDYIACSIATVSQDCSHLAACSRACIDGYCSERPKDFICSKPHDACILDAQCKPEHETADERGCVYKQRDCAAQFPDLDACSEAYCTIDGGCAIKRNIIDPACLPACSQKEDCPDSGILCLEAKCKSEKCAYFPNHELCSTSNDACIESAFCKQDRGCEYEYLSCEDDGNDCTVDDCVQGVGCLEPHDRSVPEGSEGFCCSKDQPCRSDDFVHECLSTSCVLDASSADYHHCVDYLDHDICQRTHNPNNKNKCIQWRCQREAGCVYNSILSDPDASYSSDMNCCSKTGDMEYCASYAGDCLTLTSCCSDPDAACADDVGLLNCAYTIDHNACDDSNPCSDDSCIDCKAEPTHTGCLIDGSASICEHRAFAQADIGEELGCCYLETNSQTLTPAKACTTNCLDACDDSTYQCSGGCDTGYQCCQGACVEEGFSCPKEVLPLYPNHGSQWLDYVQKTGSTHYNSADTPCEKPVDGYYHHCIHGGEHKMIIIEEESSCAGLEAYDELGVFNWYCLEDTNGVTFYSSGLKEGKSLADLLDPSGQAWLPNKIYIIGSMQSYESYLDKWWDNPVLELPRNEQYTDFPIVLDEIDDDGLNGPDIAIEPYSILTVPANRSTTGYNLNMDRIAVVIMSGQQLLPADTMADNVVYASGEHLEGSNDTIALLASGDQSFVWLEGTFNGKNASDGFRSILLDNLHYSRLHRLISINGNGVRLNECRANLLYDITVSNTGSSMNGLTLYQSDRNTLYRIKSVNNGYNSMLIWHSYYNTVVKALSSNNNGEGIRIDNSSFNTLVNATVTNGKQSGIHLTNNNNTLHNVLVANSYANSLEMNSYNNSLSQLVLLHNGPSEYAIETTISSPGQSYTKFTANVILGPNLGNCNINFDAGSDGNHENATAPGIDSNCEAVDMSTDITIHTMTETLDSSFVGPVTVDSSNESHSNGTAVMDYAIDLIHFDNWYRSWGNDGPAFPSTENQGQCIEGDDAQIWDWRLKQSDTVLRNTSLNFTNQNPSISGHGGPCSLTLSKQMTASDLHGGEIKGDGIGDEDGICEFGEECQSREYLIQAFEIMHDGFGNENGLCESDERCLYAPNFGVYQGENSESLSYLDQGWCKLNAPTQDIPVSGIILYRYPINGG